MEALEKCAALYKLYLEHLSQYEISRLLMHL